MIKTFLYKRINTSQVSTTACPLKHRTAVNEFSRQDNIESSPHLRPQNRRQSFTVPPDRQTPSRAEAVVLSTGLTIQPQTSHHWTTDRSHCLTPSTEAAVVWRAHHELTLPASFPRLFLFHSHVTAENSHLLALNVAQDYFCVYKSSTICLGFNVCRI